VIVAWEEGALAKEENEWKQKRKQRKSDRVSTRKDEGEAQVRR
jgi:hypothetical protein